MEVTMQRSSIPCWQSVYTQSFPLSESAETVVPDTLPDVEAILCVSGTPLIRSKDLTDGHLRLEANVPARVTCIGEGSGDLFCLDVNIPFYLSVQDERVRENGACVSDLCLRQLEPRLLNPRKLSVRAELEVTVRCYGPGAVEMALAPEDKAAEIQTMEQSTIISCICAVTEKTFVLTDEYSLPDDASPVAEIVGQNAVATVEEVKTLGSKVIVSGSVKNELICRCGEGALHALSFRTAFSQIIEVPCDAEESFSAVSILLSGMYYEAMPGSDGLEIASELHLVAQLCMWKNETISYLADAYSNTCAMELSSASCSFLRIEKETTLRENCKPVIEMPERPQAMIACSAVPVGVEQNGDVVSVQLRVTLCYQGEGGSRSAERTVTQRINAELKEGESLLISAVQVADIGAVPADSGAELRFSLELRTFLTREVSLTCVDGISLDEEAATEHDELPALVIMRYSSEQSLWELAKANCSTVEAIRAANGLDTLSEPWEKLLLIPKTL